MFTFLMTWGLVNVGAYGAGAAFAVGATGFSASMVAIARKLAGK